LNVVFAVSAALVAVPLMGLAPLQPPDAAHEVAFWLDQVRSTVLPEPTWL
jgi:hypothetical protein